MIASFESYRPDTQTCIAPQSPPALYLGIKVVSENYHVANYIVHANVSHVTHTHTHTHRYPGVVVSVT